LGLGPPEVDYYFTFCLISFFHCTVFSFIIRSTASYYQ